MEAAKAQNWAVEPQKKKIEPKIELSDIPGCDRGISYETIL
jgi:hypothetical protein